MIKKFKYIVIGEIEIPANAYTSYTDKKSAFVDYGKHGQIAIAMAQISNALTSTQDVSIDKIHIEYISER